MEQENIKEKLLKIKRLAEQGEYHEALAAKARLNALLAKHGMSIDDLDDNRTRQYEIKYKDKHGMVMLLAIMTQTIGYSRAAESTYSKHLKTVYVDATSYEYAEIMSMYSFHTANYAKERKKMLKRLETAYCVKHSLWTERDGGESAPRRELTDAEIREIEEAVKLAATLSDTLYRKQLAAH